MVIRTEKSMGTAYALLILLGQLGLHRFYLNRVGSGIAQLLLGIIGWATSFLLIGFVLLVPLWIWLVIDLFITAGMVRAANAV
ncbi:MAG: NINE protein [Deltaproteobacteria bacterium]|nr:NINE protein [Deltaproteobacteria bacterium]